MNKIEKIFWKGVDALDAKILDNRNKREFKKRQKNAVKIALQEQKDYILYCAESPSGEIDLKDVEVALKLKELDKSNIDATKVASTAIGASVAVAAMAYERNDVLVGTAKTLVQGAVGMIFKK